MLFWQICSFSDKFEPLIRFIIRSTMVCIYFMRTYQKIADTCTKKNGSASDMSRSDILSSSLALPVDARVLTSKSGDSAPPWGEETNWITGEAVLGLPTSLSRLNESLDSSLQVSELELLSLKFRSSSVLRNFLLDSSETKSFFASGDKLSAFLGKQFPSKQAAF